MAYVAVHHRASLGAATAAPSGEVALLQRAANVGLAMRGYQQIDVDGEIHTVTCGALRLVGLHHPNCFGFESPPRDRTKPQKDTKTDQVAAFQAAANVLLAAKGYEKLPVDGKITPETCGAGKLLGAVYYKLLEFKCSQFPESSWVPPPRAQVPPARTAAPTPAAQPASATPAPALRMLLPQARVVPSTQPAAATVTATRPAQNLLMFRPVAAQVRTESPTEAVTHQDTARSSGASAKQEHTSTIPQSATIAAVVLIGVVAAFLLTRN